ncbi:hypothetical protein [Clostridium gasigenes]|nr:hypothetical protein [Clostridium gasigenes]
MNFTVDDSGGVSLNLFKSGDVSINGKNINLSWKSKNRKNKI